MDIVIHPLYYTANTFWKHLGDCRPLAGLPRAFSPRAWLLGDAGAHPACTPAPLHRRDALVPQSLGWSCLCYAGGRSRRSLSALPSPPPDKGGGLGPYAWLRYASPRPPYLGTMGSVMWEGYCALCRMVCNAGLSSVPSAIRFPVLGFRSKRGKLLLETSTLIRCPALKTLLVVHRSIV